MRSRLFYLRGAFSESGVKPPHSKGCRRSVECWYSRLLARTMRRPWVSSRFRCCPLALATWFRSSLPLGALGWQPGQAGT
jgi:hypothetical protein